LDAAREIGGSVLMGAYERWILPRLLDLAMRAREATRYRKGVIPAASGHVLEIGIGSGLNLPFYGSAVTRLYGLDPSKALLAMARKKRPRAGFPVELIERSAEDIPLENRSIDTVVSTWTLCTVPDATRALREAWRVLKPGGTLLFVEHGHAPDPNVQLWQRRLDPLWSRIAGGCHLDRRIDRLIVEAGFELVRIEKEYADAPRPLGYMYHGRAQPR
jgi:ubiquinone/menaquinone biosynthesis C-methylase UbiE